MFVRSRSVRFAADLKALKVRRPADLVRTGCHHTLEPNGLPDAGDALPVFTHELTARVGSFGHGALVVQVEGHRFNGWTGRKFEVSRRPLAKRTVRNGQVGQARAATRILEIQGPISRCWGRPLRKVALLELGLESGRFDGQGLRAVAHGAGPAKPRQSRC